MADLQKLLAFDAALPKTARRVFAHIQEHRAELPKKRRVLTREIADALSLNPRVVGNAVARLASHKFITIEENNVQPPGLQTTAES